MQKLTLTSFFGADCRVRGERTWLSEGRREVLKEVRGEVMWSEGVKVIDELGIRSQSILGNIKL